MSIVIFDIIDLYKLGLNDREIARQLNIKRGRVLYLRKRFGLVTNNKFKPYYSKEELQRSYKKAIERKTKFNDKLKRYNFIYYHQHKDSYKIYSHRTYMNSLLKGGCK